jgi:hypothetical protein
VQTGDTKKLRRIPIRSVDEFVEENHRETIRQE